MNETLHTPAETPDNRKTDNSFNGILKLFKIPRQHRTVDNFFFEEVDGQNYPIPKHLQINGGDYDLRENGALLSKGAYVDLASTFGPRTIIEHAATVQNSDIGARTVVGEFTNIHSAEIGEDGAIEDYAGINHSGGETVKIGSNVRVGGFVLVASGVEIFDGSILGPYTKIESRSMLGEDCKVGENTTVRSGANIASEVKIGNRVVVGMNSEIGERVQIENGAIIKTDVKIGKGSRVLDHTLVDAGAHIKPRTLVYHKDFFDRTTKYSKDNYID